MTMIEKLINYDRWASAEGVWADLPFFLRFRTPILEPSEIGSHIHRVDILWPYAELNTGIPPSHEDSEAMDIFENRLVETLESNVTAVLTAVLIFDGAREWIFYTNDIEECVRLINEMPQDAEPYPIEVTTVKDEKWSFLRDKILGVSDYKKYQEEWRAAFMCKMAESSSTPYGLK